MDPTGSSACTMQSDCQHGQDWRRRDTLVLLKPVDETFLNTRKRNSCDHHLQRSLSLESLRVH